MVELSNTWLTSTVQRTLVNTDTILLWLCHAIEPLECNRIEFENDVNNTRSHAAIANLEAVGEGIRRQHMVPGRRIRITAVVNIIRADRNSTTSPP